MFLEGGYGDYIIFANWFEYFRQKFMNGTVHVDIYGSGALKSIFNYKLDNVNAMLFAERTRGIQEYDIHMQIMRFPVIQACNDKKIEQRMPALFDYVQKIRQYCERNKMYIENKPYLDGLLGQNSVMSGMKRWNQIDICSFFGIKEDFIFHMHSEENAEKYLASLGLSGKKFITVHRGWDAAYKKNVKPWSLRACGDLMETLKKEFPDYKIVLFGAKKEQAPSGKGADLNLVGKTSLEQVKVLLKHAILHIDNEGGMVHLRHALKGGPSVVLFGPTSKDLFGYSENINISSEVCPGGCEWLSKNWYCTCSKGAELPLCMEALNTEIIVSAIKNRRIL